MTRKLIDDIWGTIYPIMFADGWTSKPVPERLRILDEICLREHGVSFFDYEKELSKVLGHQASTQLITLNTAS